MKKIQREYKVIDFPPLTAEEKATLEEMASRPASEINCDDIPDSKPTANGGFYYIQSLKMPKTDIHTKIDNDNLAWLKQAGHHLPIHLQMGGKIKVNGADLNRLPSDDGVDRAVFKAQPAVQTVGLADRIGRAGVDGLLGAQAGAGVAADAAVGDFKAPDLGNAAAEGEALPDDGGSPQVEKLELAAADGKSLENISGIAGIHIVHPGDGDLRSDGELLIKTFAPGRAENQPAGFGQHDIDDAGPRFAVGVDGGKDHVADAAQLGKTGLGIHGVLLQIIIQRGCRRRRFVI